MVRIVLVLLVIGIAISLGACTKHSSGQQLDAAAVNTIQKGVTTRQEVEAKLGAPAHVSMMPDGGRTLMYNYSETANRTAFSFYGSGKLDTRRQSLQVIVGPNGIVKDYEFADMTGEAVASPFQTNVTRTERPTTQSSPPK